MSNLDPLPRLVELLAAADRTGLKMFLAGGLGVVLRVEFARVLGQPTLATPPVARSTRDIDLLLSATVIVDSGQMRELRGLLDALGYNPVPGAEFYQWVAGDGIRVDLQVETPIDLSDVQIDSRRVRPRGESVGLHARRLDEAVGCELHLVSIPLLENGVLAGVGDAPAALARTPNLFSYWSMKLLALRDTVQDPGQDYGRRHAYDMFALWASTTKPMWLNAGQVAAATADRAIRMETGEAAMNLFELADGLGRIRLKEALRSAGEERDSSEVDDMAADVLALFIGKGEAG